MRAIRVSQFGGPEVLKLEEVPDAHSLVPDKFSCTCARQE